MPISLIFVRKIHVNNKVDSLALNRRQAIIWINDGLVYWRMYDLI